MRRRSQDRQPTPQRLTRLAGAAIALLTLAGAMPGEANAQQRDQAPEQAQAQAPAPVLAGRDREHWEPTTFHPASGRITHEPVYFSTPEASDAPALMRGQPVEAQLEAALAGAAGESWTLGGVLVDLPVETLWYYIEVLIVPAKAIVNPPIADEHTPPMPAEESQ